jgi:hypothetical protein
MKKLAGQVNSYALIITVLLFGATFWLMKEKNVSHSLRDGLDSEKLRSEALLSEKLLVEKEIVRLKSQLFTVTGKSDKLDAELKQTLQKLSATESEFKKAKNENASLKQYKQQNNDLLAMQKDLHRQIESLTQSVSTAQMENQKLNAQLVSLEERNKMLADDLRRTALASMDNTEIKALRGKKERLTVKASRTKKLIAEFEIPGHMKNVSFKITDPSGKLLSNNDGTIASTFTASSNNYTASTSDAKSLGTAKVEMVFIPKEKLKSGMYKVEILSENLHLGGLQVRLK